MHNNPLSWKSKIWDKAKLILSFVLVLVAWAAGYAALVIGIWSVAFSQAGAICQGVGVLLFLWGAVALLRGAGEAARTEGYKAAYPGVQLLLFLLLLFGLYRLFVLATQLLTKAYYWYEQLLPHGIGDKICLGLVILILVIVVFVGIRSEAGNRYCDGDDYYY